MTYQSAQDALRNARVPRYTSYPPATQFTADVGPAQTAAWIAAVPDGSRISLYVHIPFCRRLCWFCACRTQGTRTDAPLDRYLDHLEKEIAQVVAALPASVVVGALHLGGGTPTLLSPDRLRRLGAMLRAAFKIAADAEISVEIDPCEVDKPRIDALLGLGMSRASVGVQDFAPQVQAAIGRPQSWKVTRDAIVALRDGGIASVNVDLLYGLPYQTAERLSHTVAQVLSLRPDRIALYGYAHVPWMARRQNLIPEDALPDADARLQLSATARQKLCEAGYHPIGIDHYALPDDSMTHAAKAGRLNRNFQGYTTDTADTLIGLGASAISRFPQGFAQNIAATGAWQRHLRSGTLATARGYVMTDLDTAVSAAITRLMCDGRVDLAQCAAESTGTLAFLTERAGIAAKGMAPYAAFADGVLTLADFDFARLLAARFDPRFSPGASKFSMAS